MGSLAPQHTCVNFKLRLEKPASLQIPDDLTHQYFNPRIMQNVILIVQNVQGE